jgi:hypothetical protein
VDCNRIWHYDDHDLDPTFYFDANPDPAPDPTQNLGQVNNEKFLECTVHHRTAARLLKQFKTFLRQYQVLAINSKANWTTFKHMD